MARKEVVNKKAGLWISSTTAKKNLGDDGFLHTSVLLYWN